MANPQKENGYTAIANEIAEQLAKVNFSAYEMRYLWVLWRKTYGWNKKNDKISLSQFEKATGLKRKDICLVANKLLKRNIIIKNNLLISFQKDYTKWGSPYRGTVPIEGMGSPCRGNKVVPVEGHTKAIKHLYKNKGGEKLKTNKKKMYQYQEINDDGEPIVKRKGMKKKITDYPFKQETEVSRLVASPVKVHNITGHYIFEKKFKYENRDQWEPDIARFIHTAKLLKGYNSRQITKAFDYCKKKWPDDWTLETVVKWIAEANKNG